MPKTPYEVRLETLQLATTIVSARWGKEGAPTAEILQEAMLLRNFIDNDSIAAIVDKNEVGRKTFFVDLGNIPPEKVEEVLTRIVDEFKKPLTSEDARQAVEGNGEIPLPEPVESTISKEDFLAKLKSDGSACCGGTGGDSCECNLPDNTGC